MTTEEKLDLLDRVSEQYKTVQSDPELFPYFLSELEAVISELFSSNSEKGFRIQLEKVKAEISPEKMNKLFDEMKIALEADTKPGPSPDTARFKPGVVIMGLIALAMIIVLIVFLKNKEANGTRSTKIARIEKSQPLQESPPSPSLSSVRKVHRATGQKVDLRSFDREMKDMLIPVSSAEIENELAARGTLVLDGQTLLVSEAFHSLSVHTLELKNGSQIVTNGNNFYLQALKIVSSRGRVLSFQQKQNNSAVKSGNERITGAGGGSVTLSNLSSIEGTLRIELAGQNGRPGRPGEAGEPGKPGRKGKDAVEGETGCLEPGEDGENGSPGSAGNDGYPGGRGGDGGDLILHNTSKEVLRKIQYYASGGSGGLGGPGGAGGPGGKEGKGGNKSSLCSGGNSGNPGDDGPSGQKGPDGEPGRNGRIVIQSPASKS